MKDDRSPRRITVGHAISVGLLWVNGPVFALLFGVPALTWYVVLGGARTLGTASHAIAFLVSILVGFVFAWTWWSITVPKWRLWAYERVEDIAALKEKAVEAGLTWPDGSVFEKTESKSAEHAELERKLEQEKSKRP